MATYFHGNTEIQAGGDGLQTLILMNPAYVGYSDTQPQLPPSATNFEFLNSNSATSAVNLSHPPPSQIQHFAGIPLQAVAASPQDSQQHQDVLELHGGSLPRVHYNFYNPVINNGAAREVTRAKQGLSLSLSSQQHIGFGSFKPETTEAPSQPPATSAAPLSGGEDVRVLATSSASGISNSMNGAQSVLLNSKYLKAAQELLDEVVNVGKEAKNATESAKEDNGQSKNVGESSGAAAAAPTGEGESGGGGDSVGKHGAELTAAEKQEIQMKKAKLVNMLDEVEQRYKQYHQQMQMVTSWFEQVAGMGSAKAYTALALQTISKQFRCLKDAILGQIRVASKNLGEEDSLGGKIEGSRLNYVDNQIRQRRALQQLGMIQHNAWRPQRGLPERSVSVLRAWLFEHFLHPYPKDSDKVMLAKQTGLSRSQVSNWFINARVRLWKPMVEEMYAEEMKEHEGNGSEDKTGKTEHNEASTSKTYASQAKSPGTEIQNKSFISKLDNLVHKNIASVTSISTSSTSPTEATMRNNVGFNLIGSSEMENITQVSPKKPRNADMLHSPRSIPSMNMDSKPSNLEDEHMTMKFGNEGQVRDGFTLRGVPTNFIYGSYPIMELGRFGPEQFQAPYSGNGVSLTLGLQHCDNISMSGAPQTFLPNQSTQLGRDVEICETNDFSGMNAPTATQSTSVYENINIQNRKRFAAQLLPADFVN